MATTKVVLLDNVAKLGRKYDVKEVAAGYARNFLLPNNKAVLATKGVIENLDTLKTQLEADKNVAWKEFVKNTEKLEGQVIELTVKANEEGHLYGAIHPENVAEKIKADYGLSVEPEWLVMSNSIKETGEHKIIIGEGEDKITITLKVSAEE